MTQRLAFYLPGALGYAFLLLVPVLCLKSLLSQFSKGAWINLTKTFLAIWALAGAIGVLRGMRIFELIGAASALACMAGIAIWISAYVGIVIYKKRTRTT